MLGSLARRQRRPLWGTLSFILAVGIGLSVWAATLARREATRRAASDAEVAAQSELVPLLRPRDLTAPITGERARRLTAGIERQITSIGPIEAVRIYSSLGQILFAKDPGVVGTRPSSLLDLAFEVANGQTQSHVRGGLLRTYVPVSLEPNGPVAVAELSQPFEPISARATAGWYRLALILGGLLVLCAAMVVASGRRAAPSAAPVLADDATGRTSRVRRPPSPDGPLYQHPGFRALEEQRREAEARASAAEESFRAVQGQLRQALAQIKELEGRLAVSQTQSTQSDGELRALRDQLRDTAERLHGAELDRDALRERLALRQRELDEARSRTVEVADARRVQELTARLEAAEARTAEMAREVERLEAELDRTRGRLHMAKLSEALRELDSDDGEIGAGEGPYERPVIIGDPAGSLSPGKAR